MSPPAVDFIDLRRLARALYLKCERGASGCYYVSGGAEPHTVQLGEKPSCDCRDFEIRGRICKHILRARLKRGDDAIIGGLQLLIPFPEQRIAELAILKPLKN